MKASLTGIGKEVLPNYTAEFVELLNCSSIHTKTIGLQIINNIGAVGEF